MADVNVSVQATAAVVIRAGEPSSITLKTNGVTGPQGPRGEPGVPGPPGPPPDLSGLRLEDLSDIDITRRVDESILCFDASRDLFVANDINTLVTLTDGGNF